MNGNNSLGVKFVLDFFLVIFVSNWLGLKLKYFLRVILKFSKRRIDGKCRC